MGSGAFTTVSARRTVSVGVADDSNALLALEARSDNDNRAYADGGGDRITVDIGGSGASGSGINTAATTTVFDIFAIENQGTQSALVYVPPSSVDDDGGFDQTDDGVYFDPQVSDMPNGSNTSAIATLSDGTPYASFTNIGGTILDKGKTFPEATLDTSDNAGPHPPEVYLLNPGESFDFGVYLKADDTASLSTFDFDIQIKADSELAEEAGVGSTNGGIS
jgi:hypothetical protein